MENENKDYIVANRKGISCGIKKLTNEQVQRLKNNGYSIQKKDDDENVYNGFNKTADNKSNIKPHKLLESIRENSNVDEIDDNENISNLFEFDASNYQNMMMTEQSNPYPCGYGKKIIAGPAQNINGYIMSPSVTTKNKAMEFINRYSIKDIEKLLNERIVDQPKATQDAAMFLYYHALKQINSELPLRPMLLTGPIGTGKTEIFKVMKELFGNYFKIKIIDGSMITQEGFKGDNKLKNQIDRNMSNGGILVIDEFDKLVKPKYASGGDNVSESLQAEMLKMLDGDFEHEEKDRFGPTGRILTTKMMGIALVGAFADANKRSFSMNNAQQELKSCFVSLDERYLLSDNELINYGMTAELLSRLSIRSYTTELSERSYIDVIQNKHSRVSKIISMLASYGIDASELVSDEKLKKIIQESRSKKLGIRYTMSYIENIALNNLRFLKPTIVQNDDAVLLKENGVISQNVNNEQMNETKETTNRNMNRFEGFFF